MSLRFTPPKMMGRYALFVDHGEGSNATFKVYNDLGHAKNGARVRTRHWGDKTRNAAKILEFIDGDWWVLYDIPVGTAEFPWYKDVPDYRQGWDSETLQFRTVKKARPLTREEYAEFRTKVVLEQHGLVGA